MRVYLAALLTLVLGTKIIVPRIIGADTVEGLGEAYRTTVHVCGGHRRQEWVRDEETEIPASREPVRKSEKCSTNWCRGSC
jgi:hypothetical protein